LGTAVTGGMTSLWFLTRGTGVVALLLLTVSLALGVANVRRLHADGWPRFVVELVHRNAALLAIVFLLIHIVTSVLDPFAPIALADAVIPFISAYRPIWLGLGALAFDLMLAVAITSVWRRRIGYRVWRWVHWASYACWPIAVVHGLGTGTDSKARWMLLLVAVCVLVVIVAAASRAIAGWPDHVGARLSGLVACAAVPVALVLWLPSGPLATGWAARAGTPTTVLAAARSSAPAAASSSFTANVSGPIAQSADENQRASVHMLLTVAGQHLGALHVLIEGQPANGGGLAMTSSAVTLGTAADPHLYTGQITALNGSAISATVRDRSGHSYALSLRLQIDSSSQTASGVLTATAGGSH
jgi:sulfoxide reductase heme-binding subunit YedZ